LDGDEERYETENKHWTPHRLREVPSGHSYKLGLAEQKGLSIIQKREQGFCRCPALFLVKKI